MTDDRNHDCSACEGRWLRWGPTLLLTEGTVSTRVLEANVGHEPDQGMQSSALHAGTVCTPSAAITRSAPECLEC